MPDGLPAHLQPILANLWLQYPSGGIATAPRPDLQAPPPQPDPAPTDAPEGVPSA